MGFGNRYQQVLQAAIQYLRLVFKTVTGTTVVLPVRNAILKICQSALPVNSYVGLVAFHGRAQTLARLTLIHDRDSWQVLKARLHMSKLQPYTSIGGALREALKILKTSGPKDLRGGGMCSNISLALECDTVKITGALQSDNLTQIRTQA